MSEESKYHSNKSIRAKIDRRLRDIASLNANLGIDSTITEYKKIQREIKKLNKEIKDICPIFYKEIELDD